MATAKSALFRSHTLCRSHWPQAASGKDADMADGLEKAAVVWVGMSANKSFHISHLPAHSRTGSQPQQCHVCGLVQDTTHSSRQMAHEASKDSKTTGNILIEISTFLVAHWPEDLPAATWMTTVNVKNYIPSNPTSIPSIYACRL